MAARKLLCCSVLGELASAQQVHCSQRQLLLSDAWLWSDQLLAHSDPGAFAGEGAFGMESLTGYGARGTLSGHTHGCIKQERTIVHLQPKQFLADTSPCMIQRTVQAGLVVGLEVIHGIAALQSVLLDWKQLLALVVYYMTAGPSGLHHCALCVYGGTEGFSICKKRSLVASKHNAEYASICSAARILAAH